MPTPLFAVEQQKGKAVLVLMLEVHWQFELETQFVPQFALLPLLQPLHVQVFPFWTRFAWAQDKDCPSQVTVHWPFVHC